MSILLPKKMMRRGALRGLLGGGAVTLALPFLDCVLNENGTALAATGAPLPVRFGTWYWGLGHTPGHAVGDKSKTGPGIAFLEETLPLKPYEQNLVHFGNFGVPLDGNTNYTHFSGWVATRTGSAPTRGGQIPAPTLDLIIADTIGKNTRFQTVNATSVGIARENYSARSTDSRAAIEISPVALYHKLFGSEFVDPNTADFKPDPAIMVEKSVLSAFMEESRDYLKTLGAADKARMDEYFTSVRDVETQLALQLQKPEPNEACHVPAPPGDMPEEERASGREIPNVLETHRIMTKLMAMALACNQTRVFNLVFSDNFGNVRRKGDTYTHHLLTHSEIIDAKLGYQPVAFYLNKKSMEGFADFMQIMSGIREGAGTLLDNCLVFASTETNYARLHTVDGLPVWWAGKAGGRIKTSIQVVGNGDPITRVGMTAMKVMGVPIDTWGTKSLQTTKSITDIIA